MSEQEIKKQNICKDTTQYKEANGEIVYLLNLKPCGSEGLGIRKFEFGTPNETAQEKTLMLLGATGAGKTTLLNAMTNYVMGVQFEDDFRVKLIPEEAGVANQAKSQTRTITSYTLHHQPWFQVPCTLTIVDTPGFGDTDGPDMDKKITEQIERFFKTKGSAGLDHISAIGFVVQSSLARLTDNQQYIFDSILSLFGRDIEENIIPLCTFADGKKPKALTALSEAKINVKTYFKFNNSGLFKDDDDDDDDDGDEEDRMNWEKRTKSLKSLFETLMAMREKSLLLTQELMEEKETLKMQLDGINQEINLGAAKMIQLDQEKMILVKHEKEIKKESKFTYQIKEPKKSQENAAYGTKAKNCKKCERTCHYPCDSKYWCPSVTLLGYCKFCECHKNDHEFSSQRYVTTMVYVTKTYQDVKKKYEQAMGKAMGQEGVVKCLAADVEKMRDEVILKNVQARKCRNRIYKIALKATPLSTDEYIKEMIKKERLEHTDGYEARIEQLEKVHKISEILNELSTEGFDVDKNDSDTAAKVKERYIKY